MAVTAPPGDGDVEEGRTPQAYLLSVAQLLLPHDAADLQARADRVLVPPTIDPAAAAPAAAVPPPRASLRVAAVLGRASSQLESGGGGGSRQRRRPIAERRLLERRFTGSLACDGADTVAAYVFVVLLHSFGLTDLHSRLALLFPRTRLGGGGVGDSERGGDGGVGSAAAGMLTRSGDVELCCPGVLGPARSASVRASGRLRGAFGARSHPLEARVISGGGSVAARGGGRRSDSVSSALDDAPAVGRGAV